jgi:hypothetical protein
VFIILLPVSRLTDNRHIARLVAQFELGRVAAHFTAKCARRVAAQVVQMNRAGLFVARVICADMNAVDREYHVVLLRWHQW